MSHTLEIWGLHIVVTLWASQPYLILLQRTLNGPRSDTGLGRSKVVINVCQYKSEKYFSPGCNLRLSRPTFSRKDENHSLRRKSASTDPTMQFDCQNSMSFSLKVFSISRC